MRPTALAGVFGLLIAAHAVRPAAAAEPTAYRAVVSDAEVKLRAGPSDQFPETGTLKRGRAVVVEREEGGWLAVTAPHGSVSWIAFAFVEDLAPDRPTPKNGLVEAEGEVTVAAGKAGLAQPLDVRREKVPQGTAVLLIGPPVEFAGKKWWPIAPPPGDVRYLPKTAVQYEKPAANNFTVRVNDSGGPVPPGAGAPAAHTASPLATVPGPGGPQPAGGVTASKPAVNHPLWAQAEAAERDGRLADAEKAYFELAAVMNGQGGDHDIANLCYTRIHAIRERKRNAGGTAAKADFGATAPLKTDVLQPPAKEERARAERGVRPGMPTPLPPGAGRNPGAANPPKPGDDGARWTGPGVIRRSVLTPDGTGKPAYALETAPGVVRAYVVGGDGVNMEQYLGKRVEVYGELQSGKLSKPYVVASKVEPAQ